MIEKLSFNKDISISEILNELEKELSFCKEYSKKYSDIKIINDEDEEEHFTESNSCIISNLVKKDCNNFSNIEFGDDYKSDVFLIKIYFNLRTDNLPIYYSEDMKEIFTYKLFEVNESSHSLKIFGYEKFLKSKDFNKKLINLVTNFCIQEINSKYKNFKIDKRHYPKIIKQLMPFS